MDSPILYQLGIFILFVLVCVGVYQIRGRWNAWHLVACVMLFLASVFFMVVAAASLKARDWLKEKDRIEEQLVQVRADADRLLHGDPLDPASTADSVSELRAAISRALLDRGRVWRGVAPQAVEADLTVAIAAPQAPAPVNPAPNAEAPPPGDPGAAPPAAAAPPAGGVTGQIKTNDVLYVFEEGNVNGRQVPTFYIGEFRVVSRDAATIKMKSLLPPDPVQIAAIKAQQGVTWALYEVMPIDSHYAFADDPEFRPDLEKEEPLFGAWNDQALQTYFQPSVSRYIQGLQLDPAFANVPMAPWVQEPRDGYVLSQELADTGGAEIKANIWQKVRFQKDWTLAGDEVDVKADDAAPGAFDSGYFDTRGRTVVDFLRSEGDLKFRPQTLALFRKVPEGEQVVEGDDILRTLVDAGTVDPLAPYYLRPLKDFNRVYFATHSEIRRLALENDDTQRAIAVAEKDAANLAAQRAVIDEQNANFEQEKTLFTAEQQQVSAYRDRLAQRVAQLRQELNKMARENAELASQLARLQTGPAPVATGGN